MLDKISNAILETYFKVAKKYKKPYCWPAQKLMLVLLAKYHGIKISLRTLNRRLRFLEDGKYISRLQRGRRRKDGTFQPGSTLTTIMSRSFWYMAKGMKKAFGIFSFYRMPKLAHNMFTSTDYKALVDKLQRSVEKFVHQGGAPRFFNSA